MTFSYQVDIPNSVHAFQTAERIREIHPDKPWFHVTGLIHDLGKVMAMWGEPQVILHLRVPNTFRDIDIEYHDIVHFSLLYTKLSLVCIAQAGKMGFVMKIN